ncbi:MAG: tRNA (adenosine(37)-N6)-threonylcarbamoyltransferase complex dimerization subunit type 1 TsaB [Polyangiaceae bacterium]
MTTLAISTSTPRGSVALVEDDRVLAEASHDDLRGHAEHLFGLIDDALARAGRTRADLRLVACDVGPGSFTGVRVAVASAKGIAVGLGLPLAGVVSLEAMAAHARSETTSEGEEPLVAVAIDAKKDELYIAVYDGDVALLAPEHAPVRAASERVLAVAGDRPLVTIADAAAFVDFAGPGDRIARRLIAPPSALWVARVAGRRLAARGAVTERDASMDPAEVVPLYVRAPDAVPASPKAPGAFATLPPR